MTSFQCLSFAKVNLGLRIKYKREDGFHELETILQQIDLHDVIEFTLGEGDGPTMTCSNPEVPVDESNLCLKAVRSLENLTGQKINVAIKLTKNIPAGAGLGGGSGNAATILTSLNSVLEIGLRESELLALAAKLGSDVPFFIKGGCVLATGRGEVLESVPVRFKDYTVLVVFPAIEVSTGWAYQNLNLNLTRNEKNGILTSFKDRGVREIDLLDLAVNDFESVVFRRFPQLLSLKQQLLEGGATFASLSGSGSLVFGLFKNKADAERISELVSSEYEVFLTRFVSGVDLPN